ncbi:MAG TPA: hypothetical protein VN700_07875 [Vicinamibacterales bacterium]|nr:hypothetical protein [Vicinamibacterales bacterium]
MGLFKSKEERRLERTMKVRQAVAQLRRQIKDSEKHETAYVQKAKRSRKLGWNNQYEFLKKAIKKTATVKVQLERQLLALESASQIKEQTESHAQFASAMSALSKSISEAFGITDLAKTQVNFEKAMAQASNLEERMDTFLDMTSETMFGYEGSPEGELVSDADIDRMLVDEVTREERTDTGLDLDADIASVERELDRAKK